MMGGLWAGVKHGVPEGPTDFMALSEDVDDLEAFERRENEPDYEFEDVVRDLRRRSST